MSFTACTLYARITFVKTVSINLETWYFHGAETPNSVHLAVRPPALSGSVNTTGLGAATCCAQAARAHQGLARQAAVLPPGTLSSVIFWVSGARHPGSTQGLPGHVPHSDPAQEPLLSPQSLLTAPSPGSVADGDGVRGQDAIKLT